MSKCYEAFFHSDSWQNGRPNWLNPASPPRLHLSAFSWPPSPLECGRHIRKPLTSINHIQGVRGVEFLQWLRARVSLFWVGKETVCRQHFTICDCWTKLPSTCQYDDLSGDHISLSQPWEWQRYRRFHPSRLQTVQSAFSTRHIWLRERQRCPVSAQEAVHAWHEKSESRMKS